jgi:hypothetical protein
VAPIVTHNIGGCQDCPSNSKLGAVVPKILRSWSYSTQAFLPAASDG